MYMKGATFLFLLVLYVITLWLTTTDVIDLNLECSLVCAKKIKTLRQACKAHSLESQHHLKICNATASNWLPPDTIVLSTSRTSCKITAMGIFGTLFPHWPVLRPYSVGHLPP